MRNPCKRCLVQSMCEDECVEFVEYLCNRLECSYLNYNSFISIARKVRRGDAILYNYDRRWKHVITNHLVESV